MWQLLADNLIHLATPQNNIVKKMGKTQTNIWRNSDHVSVLQPPVFTAMALEPVLVLIAPFKVKHVIPVESPVKTHAHGHECRHIPSGKLT